MFSIRRVYVRITRVRKINNFIKTTKMSPVNLLELNSNDFKSFLDSFDHVFSDCDGVIWAKTPLLGSGDFFRLMKKLGKTVYYVSNNSLRSKEGYEEKFRSVGLEGGYEKLTVPSFAIVEYLKSIKFNKKVYCVCCAQTIKILEDAGFQCKYGPDIGADYYDEYIKYTIDDEEIGAVVFDSDFKVNLPKLYKAKSYLLRPDVIFINGASDKLVPLQNGRVELGTGAFTDLVIEQVKRTPVQLAKPGKLFGEFAMNRAGVTDPSSVLFIGDMIDQDILLGKEIGFKTLLVLTNIPKETMMAHDVKPDYYAPSLGSLVEKLENV